MCFNSTQIGFCGKIKQLNDFFAIIIMSLDQLTSSSCLFFRLYSSEVHKLDLISKIYRNQNYVFNNPTIVVKSLRNCRRQFKMMMLRLVILF
jgi:hypothetical protein